MTIKINLVEAAWGKMYNEKANKITGPYTF